MVRRIQTCSSSVGIWLVIMFMGVTSRNHQGRMPRLAHQDMIKRAAIQKFDQIMPLAMLLGFLFPNTPGVPTVSPMVRETEARAAPPSAEEEGEAPTTRQKPRASALI